MGPGTSSLTASMTVRRIVRKYASRAGASNTTQGDLQGLVRVIDEAAEKGYARGSTVDTVRRELGLLDPPLVRPAILKIAFDAEKQIRNEEGVRIVSLYESKVSAYCCHTHTALLTYRCFTRASLHCLSPAAASWRPHVQANVPTYCRTAQAKYCFGKYLVGAFQRQIKADRLVFALWEH